MKIKYVFRDDLDPPRMFLEMTLNDGWTMCVPLDGDAELPFLFRAVADAVDRHFAVKD